MIKIYFPIFLIISAALFYLFGRDANGELTGTACGMIFLMGVFGIICILELFRKDKPYDPDAVMKQMEESGQLASQDHHATRAFQIEEFEDEGSHYVIELADGSVLSLVGQYLYEYEPITDDPELNQPRTFPCTDFTLKIDKAHGYPIAIDCRGEVLEPECVAPPYTKQDILNDRIMEDWLIITDRTYDEIKRERLECNRK